MTQDSPNPVGMHLVQLSLQAASQVCKRPPQGLIGFFQYDRPTTLGATVGAAIFGQHRQQLDFQAEELLSHRLHSLRHSMALSGIDHAVDHQPRNQAWPRCAEYLDQGVGIGHGGHIRRGHHQHKIHRRSQFQSLYAEARRPIDQDRVIAFFQGVQTGSQALHLFLAQARYPKTAGAPRQQVQLTTHGHYCIQSAALAADHICQGALGLQITEQVRVAQPQVRIHQQGATVMLEAGSEGCSQSGLARTPLAADYAQRARTYGSQRITRRQLGRFQDRRSSLPAGEAQEPPSIVPVHASAPTQFG